MARRAGDAAGPTSTPGLVGVAASTAGDTERALDEIQDGIRRSMGGGEPRVVFGFHSIRHDPARVAAGMAARFPEACTVGCTSSGELGPAGFQEGGISAFALGGRARAAVRFLPDLSRVPLDQAASLVGALAAGIHRSPLALHPERHLLITLIDGLSSSGEHLLAALADAAPGIPIVGASAGDDGRLDRTWAWARGDAAPGAGALVLVEPAVPFVTFAVHHFRATDQRMVVTGARAGANRVRELDGRPALEVLARVVGIDGEQLRSSRLPALPLQPGFLVGSDLFMRGIMAVDGDELVVGGAVEEGMVLRLGRAGDIVEATREGLSTALQRLPGPPAGILEFNCAGRLAQCEESRLSELHAVSSPAPVAGCSTYGEQFGPLQVNYTLTGVIFARAREVPGV